MSRHSLESQADKVLDSLYGYRRRQEVQVQDQAYMTSILAEWDRQVTELLGQRDALQRQNDQLAELNRRNEWRLAGRGMGHYIKFLLGVVECPSR